MADTLGDGPRIVVAADSLPLQLLIAGTAADAGCSISMAFDAAEALDLFGRGKVDLAIVTEWLSGPVGGVEMIRRARRLQPGLKTLFIGEICGASTATGSDLDEVIARPFEPRRLLERIYDLLLRGTGPDVAPLFEEAAEFAIAAARQACLENRPLSA